MHDSNSILFIPGSRRNGFDDFGYVYFYFLVDGLYLLARILSLAYLRAHGFLLTQ